MVPKIQAVKDEETEKSSISILKRTFFIVSTLTLGVQRRYVPHFKGLISGNLDFEAQGHDSTFTFFLAL